MSNPLELHNKATQLYKNAREELDKGNKAAFEELLQDSFKYEAQAAELLYSRHDAEPTRSVLFRSAASLAIQCKDFSKARILVYSGLSGKPNTDIKAELEYLLSEYIDNPLLIEKGQKEDFTYLLVLRDYALNFRLQPISLHYSHAVIVENILSFLQNIQFSWEQFLEINFRKEFSLKMPDIEKMVPKFKRELPLLFVNQKFASFGVSIVCDTTISSPSNYSSEFNNWKKHIFNDFKSEVFLNDLEDQNHIQFIKRKYSIEESNQIFKKIIDSRKESNSYHLSLTNKTYSLTEKIFRPVSKPIKDQIIGRTPEAKVEEERLVLRQFAMVSPNSGRKEIFDQSIMRSGSWEISLGDIENKEGKLFLRESIELLIKYDAPNFYLDFDILNIHVSATSFQEVKDLFISNFISIYKSITSIPDNSLSIDEASMKGYLNSIVFTQGINRE